MKKILIVLLFVGVAFLVSAETAPAPAVDPAVQSQIDAIKGVLPKFAIPMREVGDRFQNIWFAAKGGNWGLAAYMSKYMNNSMKPASLTKPAEYPSWATFYTNGFDGVNKAIAAQDFATFDSAYTKVIKSCNGCHAAMGYGFITVVKQKTPSDEGIDYSQASQATDVPK